MPTNPIGHGTCNLTVNVQLTVRATLGRFANLLDVSMGELCRRLIAAGAHVARAFRIAQRERRQAELLQCRLRGILADGQVTAEEVVQLRDECLPCTSELVADAAAIAEELKLAKSGERPRSFFCPAE